MTETPSIHACAKHIESCLHDHAEQLVTQWHAMPSGLARDTLQSRLGLLRIWESAMAVLITSCEEFADLGTGDTSEGDLYAAQLAYLRDKADVFTISPELADFVITIPEQERQRGYLHAQQLADHPTLQRKSSKAKKKVQQFLDGIPDEYEQLATPVLAFLNLDQRMTEIRCLLEQRGSTQQVENLLGPWGSIPRSVIPPLSWY